MISESVFLMTVIDIAIIAVAVYAALILYRYREPVAALGVLRSAVTMVIGVLIIAALYLLDLVAMYLLPPLFGPTRAMRNMQALHLEWSWGVVLVGVATMVSGMVFLTRDLLPRTASAMRMLSSRNDELTSSQMELEHRFRAVADAVPVGVVIARHGDGQLLFGNDMWYRMFGVEPGEPGHCVLDSYVDPQERAELLRCIERGGTAGPTEISARRADGSAFRAVISSTGIEFEGERAVLSGLLDTTEQHSIQRRLGDSESRFRAIAEATPYPLFIARRSDGRLLYANEMVRAKIGFADDPLEHRSIEMYWDDRDRDPLLAALQRDGRRLATEVRHRTASGEMFWAITSSVALEFEGEDAILTSFVDISDRKVVEAELSAHRDRLEELVEERARELRDAQEELLRKERLAAVGQVTATVGHELRNPLGSISTSFEVLRPHIDTAEPRAARALERIERNVTRCSRIIDELMDYTRSRPLVLQSLHLDTWLRELQQELEDAGDVGVVTSFDSGARPSVDHDRLRQAVLNVIDNARQSMETNDPEHRTLTLRSRVSGERVEIEVTDTGRGIEAEEMKSIFEPLFSTRAFGVGLGLPLVKEIMSELRGGIEVTSEPGVGTSVLLWLPAGDPAPA